MEILKKITKGRIKKPFFMLLAGPPGIGKTTFAAGSENALIIGPEEGSYNLDVSRAPKANSLNDILNVIDELRSQDHEFKTLVIDSLSATEPLVWEAVCKVDGSKSIEQAQGGFGKGYTMANKMWQNLISSLHSLRDEKNMNIIVIAHSMIKPFNDPMLAQPYDRYVISLNEKASALWSREVDVIGFANYEIFLKIGQTEKKNKALSENNRILYLNRRPEFEAKNRLGLPDEMPLLFSEFENHLKNAYSIGSVESITLEIQDLLQEVKDQDLKDKITASIIGANQQKLMQIKNRIKEILK